jgi:hypothetical protein
MVIKMLAGSHRAIFKLPSPTEVILSFTIKKVSAITLNEQKKKTPCCTVPRNVYI